MDEQKSNWTEVGTHQCGLFFGALGVAVAFLLIFLGFWKTLLVTALFAVGYVMGAFRNKGDALKQFINNLFPPRGQSTKQ